MKLSFTTSYWLKYLCVLLTVISLAITITIHFTPLYYLQEFQHHLAQSVGLTRTQLFHNYHQLLAYLDLLWIKELQLPDFPSSSSGTKHFYEVKRLFLFNYAVLLVTFVPSLRILKQLYRQKMTWLFIRPIQWTALVFGLLLFLMAIGFERFFIYFHQILFRNTDWLFDPATDPIINVLPESFFMQCFLLFFGLLLLSLVTLYTIGKKQLKEK